MSTADDPFGDLQYESAEDSGESVSPLSQAGASFTVDDADRSLHRLGRYADQLEAIKKWAADAAAALQPKIDRERESLAAFMVGMRKATGKNDIRLPAGELTIRKRPVSTKRDDEKLLAFLGGRIADARFWKQSPAWKEIMGLLEEDKDGCFVVKGDGEVVEPDVLAKVHPEDPYSLTAKDIHGRKL